MSERGVVNAAGGLNLRAEPHRMGRIIETMPLWTALGTSSRRHSITATSWSLQMTDRPATHTHYLQGA